LTPVGTSLAQICSSVSPQFGAGTKTEMVVSLGKIASFIGFL